MVGHIARVARNQAGKRLYKDMLSNTFISVPSANMRREVVQQGDEAMKIDFSSVNLAYLIHVRDIAREDPDVAAPLLGMSPELASLLAQVPSEYLTKIAEIKVPLVAARGDAVWWYRLFKALIEENPEEVESVLKAAGLAVLS
jgi:hypothetical protein